MGPPGSAPAFGSSRPFSSSRLASLLRSSLVVAAVLLPLVYTLPVAVVEAEQPVIVGLGGFVMRFDPVTGNRAGTDLMDYPRIINSNTFSVQEDGSLYLGTFDALDRSGVFRVIPSTGARTPVSGGVDGFDDELLGDGPPIVRRFRTVLRVEDSLFVLRDLGGPMEIDIASGDRREITLTDQLETTTSLHLAHLQDMVMPNRAELVVSDPVQGLVRIAVTDGARSRWFPQPTSFPLPIRMDLLPDGRLVYTILDTTDPCIRTLDLATGETSVYSGTADGATVGDGPSFIVAYDLAVDLQGRLWLYDVLTPALFEVLPNGDRRIASSASVGVGEFMPELPHSPSLGTYARPVREYVPDGWLVY